MEGSVMEVHGSGLRRIMLLALCISRICSAYIYQGILQGSLLLFFCWRSWRNLNKSWNLNRIIEEDKEEEAKEKETHIELEEAEKMRRVLRSRKTTRNQRRSESWNVELLSF